MNTTQRDRISSLITDKLLALLEEEKPSAKLLETAMKWLEKIESGDIQAPELAKEKMEELSSRVSTSLPFPVTSLPPQRSEDARFTPPRSGTRPPLDRKSLGS